VDSGSELVAPPKAGKSDDVLIDSGLPKAGSAPAELPAPAAAVPAASVGKPNLKPQPSAAAGAASPASAPATSQTEADDELQRRLENEEENAVAGGAAGAADSSKKPVTGSGDAATPVVQQPGAEGEVVAPEDAQPSTPASVTGNSTKPASTAGAAANGAGEEQPDPVLSDPVQPSAPVSNVTVDDDTIAAPVQNATAVTPGAAVNTEPKQSPVEAETEGEAEEAKKATEVTQPEDKKAPAGTSSTSGTVPAGVPSEVETPVPVLNATAPAAEPNVTTTIDAVPAPTSGATSEQEDGGKPPASPAAGTTPSPNDDDAAQPSGSRVKEANKPADDDDDGLDAGKGSLTPTPTPPPTTTTTDNEVPTNATDVAPPASGTPASGSESNPLPASKPFCELSGLRVRFKDPNVLRLKVVLESKASCVTPPTLRVLFNAKPFPSRTATVLADTRVHVESVDAAKLESAEELGGTFVLSKNGDKLVPGLHYNVRFEACPSPPAAAAAATGEEGTEAAPCTVVLGDSETFTRSLTDEQEDAKVQLVPLLTVRTPFERLSPWLSFLESKRLMETAAAERAFADMLSDLVQDDEDGVSAKRFAVALPSAEPLLLQVFVLPPAESDDETAVSAAALADRVRLLIEARQAAKTSVEPRLLEDVLAGVKSIDLAAQPAAPEKPVAPGAPAAPSVPAVPEPTTPSTPSKWPSVPTDTNDDEETKPKDPKDTADEEEEGETTKPEPTVPPTKTEEPEPEVPKPPVLPKDDEWDVKPAPVTPPKPLFDDDEDDLPPSPPAAPTRSDASVDPSAAPTFPRSDPGANQRSEDEAEPMNPLIGMLLVAAALGAIFYFCCMRSSSSSSGGDSNGGMGADSLGPMGGSNSALDDDEELGGVEMGRGSKKGGFSALSRTDEDEMNAPASSNPAAGSFANAQEEGSASKFLIGVLISIGIPSFGTGKYVAVLNDNYLTSIAQLKQLDNNDWKRLGLPLVIEEALRKALQEHTNKEGRFAVGGSAASAGAQRAKGLDLKAASKKPTGSKAGKKSSLSVSALTSPTVDEHDPFDDDLLPAAAAASASAAAVSDEEDAGKAAEPKHASGSAKKGKTSSSKGKKAEKASMVLAPPADDGNDDAEQLDDDWLEKF